MGIKGIISLVSNSSTQLYIKRFNNGNLSNGLLFFLLLTFFLFLVLVSSQMFISDMTIGSL